MRAFRIYKAETISCFHFSCLSKLQVHFSGQETLFIHSMSEVEDVRKCGCDIMGVVELDEQISSGSTGYHTGFFLRIDCRWGGLILQNKNFLFLFFILFQSLPPGQT